MLSSFPDFLTISRGCWCTSQVHYESLVRYLGGLDFLESRTPVTTELPPMDVLPILLGTMKVISSWLLLTGLVQSSAQSYQVPSAATQFPKVFKHIHTFSCSSSRVKGLEKKKHLVLSKRIIKREVTPSLVFIKAMFTSVLSQCLFSLLNFGVSQVANRQLVLLNCFKET